MPVERLRMRPWLEEIIHSQEFPGVEWIDEEQKIFRLPWKHASRNGWKINSDASLFRAWAEHTGKFKNKEKPNPKIWKANFRCALNSLPDMEEMKERRLTKGNNAFKVYKIVDRTIEKKKYSSKRCKGRYQRKKRQYSRTSSVSKTDTKKGIILKSSSQHSTAEVEILEQVEVAGFPFSVPQTCYKQHLVDHDYAVTRYFDLFEATAEKDFEQHFDTPDSTVIKTEPRSPTAKDVEEYNSFYEDDTDSQKFGDCNSRNDGDDKVMSDDEVVELIDELSSECDSLQDSLDTAMEDFHDAERCIDRLEEGFHQPKPRSSSDCQELIAAVLLESTNITKSKSMPDIQSIIKTTPQEFLQSCL